MSQLRQVIAFASGLYRQRALVAVAGYLGRDPMAQLQLRPGPVNRSSPPPPACWTRRPRPASSTCARYGLVIGSALDGVRSMSHARQLMASNAGLRQLFEYLFGLRRREPGPAALHLAKPRNHQGHPARPQPRFVYRRYPNPGQRSALPRLM